MPGSVLVMAVPPYKADPLKLAYVQVADHIAARIEAGEFPPETRLPPSASWRTSTGWHITPCARR